MEPRGGTLIFSSICRHKSCFRFKILNFNILSVFRKINIIGGMKILWIFLGVITKLDYILGVISIRFRVKVQNWDIFLSC